MNFSHLDKLPRLQKVLVARIKRFFISDSYQLFLLPPDVNMSFQNLNLLSLYAIFQYLFFYLVGFVLKPSVTT